MHQIKWCSNAPVQPPIALTNSSQLPAYGTLNLSCLPMTGNFLQVSPVHAAPKPLWQDQLFSRRRFFAYAAFFSSLLCAWCSIAAFCLPEATHGLGLVPLAHLS